MEPTEMRGGEQLLGGWMEEIWERHEQRWKIEKPSLAGQPRPLSPLRRHSRKRQWSAKTQIHIWDMIYMRKKKNGETGKGLVRIVKSAPARPAPPGPPSAYRRTGGIIMSDMHRSSWGWRGERGRDGDGEMVSCEMMVRMVERWLEMKDDGWWWRWREEKVIYRDR